MDASPENAPAPRVSVLLVSWNNAEALRRSLAALEAASSRDGLEIIVVDNGSMDACPRMDSEFPAIQMLRLPRHFGAVKAMNIAMRTASGDHLFLLEPGLEPAPEALPALSACLEEKPDAVAVCPVVEDATGEVVTRVRPLPSAAELLSLWQEGEFGGWRTARLDQAQAVEYVRPPVCLIRSRFLKGLRYIDERYGHFGWDLEIAAQVARAAKRIYLLPGARVRQSQPAAGAELAPGVRGAFAADRLLGAAVWAGKHFGWMCGFRFRAAVTLRSFGRALLSLAQFSEVRYHWAVFHALLAGQKVDGSQRAF